ncbi:hypothetical protein D3C85_1641850 [compost metagenome]
MRFTNVFYDAPRHESMNMADNLQHINNYAVSILPLGSFHDHLLQYFLRITGG